MTQDARGVVSVQRVARGSKSENKTVDVTGYAGGGVFLLTELPTEVAG